LPQTSIELFSSDIIPEAYSADDVTQRAFRNDFVCRNSDGVLTQSGSLFEADMAAPLS
jgi:hypothetical protein